MGRVKPAKARKLMIENYRRLGRIDLAAAATGISKRTHFDWMAGDPEYHAAFDACAEEVGCLIEDVVKSRAFDGVLEPVFSGGKQAMAYKLDEAGNPMQGADGKYVAIPAFVRRLSDACLIALATARCRGFNLRAENKRIVDSEGNDRDVNVTVEYVNKPLPDEASADPDTD